MLPGWPGVPSIRAGNRYCHAVRRARRLHSAALCVVVCKGGQLDDAASAGHHGTGPLRRHPVPLRADLPAPDLPGPPKLRAS
eukprot:scaffold2155_cov260-Pinguiococcus_pyrenoidosus.AAC.4